MLELLYALGFSIVLSVDSFSAAFGMGFRKHDQKEAYRFALSSGFAEGTLSAFGLAFGKHIISKIASFDHWIAFSLLLGVGLHMIYESVKKIKTTHDDNQEKKEEDFHSYGRILIVSIVTSIDALGVGMGLGIAGNSPLLYSSAIAVAAFVATLLGLKLARSLSRNLGPKVEIVGGVILILLAFPLLRI